jgi:hypothetical protein
MKAKKTLIIILVCSLVVAFGTSAFAEDWGWYECSIVKAGTAGARYRVLLNGTKTRGDSTAPTINQWFEFHSSVTGDNEKVMIATILSVLSMDSKVEALVIPGTRKSLYALYCLSN